MNYYSIFLVCWTILICNYCRFVGSFVIHCKNFMRNRFDLFEKRASNIDPLNYVVLKPEREKEKRRAVPKEQPSLPRLEASAPIELSEEDLALLQEILIPNIYQCLQRQLNQLSVKFTAIFELLLIAILAPTLLLPPDYRILTFDAMLYLSPVAVFTPFFCSYLWGRGYNVPFASTFVKDLLATNQVFAAQYLFDSSEQDIDLIEEFVPTFRFDDSDDVRRLQYITFAKLWKELDLQQAFIDLEALRARIRAGDYNDADKKALLASKGMIAQWRQSANVTAILRNATVKNENSLETTQKLKDLL